MSNPYSTPGPNPYAQRPPQQPAARPQRVTERGVPVGGVMHPGVRPGVRTPPLTVWLSVQDVATMFSVSKMTIYRLIHGLELEATRVGRLYRVKEADAKEFLLKQSTFQDDYRNEDNAPRKY